MTVTSLLVQAKILGVGLHLEGDYLRYRGRRSAIDKLLPTLRAEKLNLFAFLREREVVPTATDAVLAAQRLLRECRFPATAPFCDFLGGPGETCQRCGASCLEHHSRPQL